MRTTEIKQNDLGRWVYRTTSNYYWQTFPDWVKTKLDMDVFLKHEDYFRKIDKEITNEDMKAVISCYDIDIPIPIDYALALNKGDYIMTEVMNKEGDWIELIVDYKWYCINNIDFKRQLVICTNPIYDSWPADKEYEKAIKDNNYNGL